MNGQPVLWAKLSWPEIQELVDQGPKMAIWPLGTTEQHGWHLPVDVDTVNCWEVGLGVSARTGVPLIPALPFGESRYWQDWPGTLSLSPDTFVGMIHDVCEGLYNTGIRKILLLNGHLGNAAVLRIAVGRVQDSCLGLRIRDLSWWDVSPRVVEKMYWDSTANGARRSFHGNDGETSAYLAHSPQLVHLERASDEPDPSQPQSFFNYGSKSVSSRGGVGKPSVASAEKGREILAWAIEDLTAEINRAIQEEGPTSRS